MKALKFPLSPPLTRGTNDSACHQVHIEKPVIVPYNNDLKEISRKLRQYPTEAEIILWKRLRTKHTGFVFHCQKPIGGYIVDFYCSKAKLIVEVDGGYHLSSETRANDAVRNDTFRNLGLTVLRFFNSEVLNDTDNVVKKINKILLDSSFDKEDNP